MNKVRFMMLAVLTSTACGPRPPAITWPALNGISAECKSAQQIPGVYHPLASLPRSEESAVYEDEFQEALLEEASELGRKLHQCVGVARIDAPVTSEGTIHPTRAEVEGFARGLAADKRIDFQHVDNSCESRAHIMSGYLMRSHGWVGGKVFVTGGLHNPGNDYAWSYHVAPYVIDDVGNLLVIDPSMKTDKSHEIVFSLHGWISQFVRERGPGIAIELTHRAQFYPTTTRVGARHAPDIDFKANCGVAAGRAWHDGAARLPQRCGEVERVDDLAGAPGCSIFLDHHSSGYRTRDAATCDLARQAHASSGSLHLRVRGEEIDSAGAVDRCQDDASSGRNAEWCVGAAKEEEPAVASPAPPSPPSAPRTDDLFTWFHQGLAGNCASVALLKASAHAFGRDKAIEIKPHEGDSSMLDFRMRDGVTGTFPKTWVDETGKRMNVDGTADGKAWANVRLAAVGYRHAAKCASSNSACQRPSEDAFKAAVDSLAAHAYTRTLVEEFGLGPDVEPQHQQRGRFFTSRRYVRNYLHEHPNGACAAIASKHTFYVADGRFDLGSGESAPFRYGMREFLHPLRWGVVDTLCFAPKTAGPARR